MAADHLYMQYLAIEQVEIKTLDSFDPNNIAFVKMDVDVEDNELSVLQGAVETLKRCGNPKILFESKQFYSLCLILL